MITKFCNMDLIPLNTTWTFFPKLVILSMLQEHRKYPTSERLCTYRSIKKRHETILTDLLPPHWVDMATNKAQQIKHSWCV